MSETETVTAEAIAVRKAPLGEKRPALVDVAGFSHGIELNASMTSPFHRDNDVQWNPAVTFPVELHRPLTDIVLAASIEADVCREA